MFDWDKNNLRKIIKTTGEAEWWAGPEGTDFVKRSSSNADLALGQKARRTERLPIRLF
jgi:hypothetical protein